MLAPSSGQDLSIATQAVFTRLHDAELAPALEVLIRAAMPLGLGVAGFAAVGAVMATLLQTNFLVTGKKLAPQFSRLNPISGAKKMFGSHTLEEFARTILKLGIGGTALWWAVGSYEPLAETLSFSTGDLATALSALLGRALLATLAGMALIALADIAWVYLRHARRMRMTREELKRENKEQEGDPHFKARRKQIAIQRARRRMLSAVPKATVVITNPTHYAVALSYERGKDAAPRIVAKGTDLMAARIRQLAEEHGVPIVPNPPLARALYKLEDDAQIPAEHFQAVAEIIAFVWRMSGSVRNG
jgi:flagellar biosynthetic protein FlhB